MSKEVKNKKMNKELAEFLRYVLIGFATTALNWGVSILFKELTSLDKTAIGNTIITIISWIVAIVFFAFWMYKIFVFRSKSMEKSIFLPEFAGFIGARLLTLGVESLIILVFCDLLGFDHVVSFGYTRIVDGIPQAPVGFEIKEYYIIKLFAGVIITILNYIFSKLFIFKKGQKLTQKSSEQQ